MKKSLISQRDSQILLLIHIVLTSMLLYFVFSGAGCEQQEELGETHPGPETTLNEIAEAYFKATENPDQKMLKANFTNLYEVNQRVELGQTLKFIDTFRRVKCILRNGNKTEIALAVDTLFFDPDGNIIERKPSVDFPLVTYSLDTAGLPAQEGEHCPETSESPQQELQTLSIKDTMVAKIMEQNPPKKDQKELVYVARSIANSLREFKKRTAELNQSSQKVVQKITLHSLQVENLSISPPTKVQQKPNCSGIANCIFNAQQIQFDIVEWYNATDFRKTRTRWVVTPQLPSFPEGMIDGFGGFISKCESGFQTIVVEDDNGNPVEREYLITTCAEVLRNF